MGFFSKIKKLWSTEDKLDKAVQEFEQEAGLAEEAPVEEDASIEEDASEAEEAPEEETEAEQPEAAAKEESPVSGPEPEKSPAPQEAAPAEMTATQASAPPSVEQTRKETPAPSADSEPAVVAEPEEDFALEPQDKPEPQEEKGADEKTEAAQAAAVKQEAAPQPEQSTDDDPDPVASPVVEAQPEPEPEQTEDVAAPEPVVEEQKQEPAEVVQPVAASEGPVVQEKTAPAGPEAAPKIDAAQPQWQTNLLLELREAEPRLSIWLGLILEEVEEAGELLWERLGFLLNALEVPKEEADDFIKRFDNWLEEMEYEQVEEFRSELQYRLALALDLEDEEDERSRLFIKLSEGLDKTREMITRRIEGLLTSHDSINDEFWEELEEILIMADVGYEPSMKLVENLKERVRKAGSNDPSIFKDLLREELEEMFKPAKRITAVNPPEVVMMIGVNGVGKTTTIGKLAHRAQMQGRKVLIAAGDTFRAAAIEQLEVWAKRVGAGFFTKGEQSDPAAVAYEAIDYALEHGYDLVLLDTAGRLHTKVNLMEELKKIRRVCGKKHPGSPHRSILVVDATTGQNAMSQTKLFNEAVGVDEIILTKLDGTSKGGIVVAIAIEHGVPITFVGLGEKMEDLRPFDGKDFAQALLT